MTWAQTVILAIIFRRQILQSLFVEGRLRWATATRRVAWDINYQQGASNWVTHLWHLRDHGWAMAPWPGSVPSSFSVVLTNKRAPVMPDRSAKIFCTGTWKTSLKNHIFQSIGTKLINSVSVAPIIPFWHVKTSICQILAKSVWWITLRT